LQKIPLPGARLEAYREFPHTKVQVQHRHSDGDRLNRMVNFCRS